MLTLPRSQVVPTSDAPTRVRFLDLSVKDEAERAEILQAVATMLDHGRIGRHYHGLVTQVISGSIGFDSYEWGVDLYADDPVVFKKLIYEMRFDEASAKYGVFGDFFSGVQFSIDQLGTFLNGNAVPKLNVLQNV